MSAPLACFKAYDVRGRVPDELDAPLARRIAQAFAHEVRGTRIAVGRDNRPSSAALAAAVIEGLNDAGADALDLGLCGTELVYFAAFDGALDGGLMVTASHNPADHNGIKLIGPKAAPLGAGLGRIRDAVVAGSAPAGARRGATAPLDCWARYVACVQGFVDREALRPLRIVVDAGNGCAGLAVDRLAAGLPFELIRINHAPDGTFPHGIPNPLLPERRARTAAAVLEHRADLGVAWDGDHDRCFLFDERGGFVEGYYMVGLLAAALLDRHPGARVVHDPRLTWNTQEIVAAHGGIAVQSATGHALVKETMRRVDALYGGEMSGHHYFRDFGHCDSGMVPWLLVAELVSRAGRPLSQLVDGARAAHPVSGEINRQVADVGAALRAVESRYAPGALHLDRTDGISIEHADWRCNVRASNTEPLLRTNLETRGDPALLERMTAELLGVIDSAAPASS